MKIKYLLQTDQNASKNKMTPRLVLICYLFVVSCVGKEAKYKDPAPQVGKEKKDTMIVANLDKNRFDSEQKNGRYSFVDNKGCTHLIRKINEGYLEEISIKNDAFIEQKKYYPNGVVEIKNLAFHGHGFVKGVVYHFDKNGKCVSEINQDTAYKNYPWEKVKRYLEERGADLMDKLTTVWRENGVWYLNWDTKKMNDRGDKLVQHLEIDANLARVIKDSVLVYKQN